MFHFGRLENGVFLYASTHTINLWYRNSKSYMMDFESLDLIQ